jgi:hypothetical protein
LPEVTDASLALEVLVADDDILSAKVVRLSTL